MTLRPVAIITQREVRDILADWRIVLPISLLTFILPLLIATTSGYVITFLQDERLADGLIPFGLLLVGFIPASFSIVTALESFVGERERNTLEALLSMPVSDQDLYVSKLAASLLPPLLSSYISMLIFTSLLYLFYPTLYLYAMTPERLLLLLLVVGLMATAMVAGAVVISSHISTIRAANLMSSLILLPAALVVQIAASLIITNRWDVMWLVMVALALAAGLFIRLGLTRFNREEILSREHQYLTLPPLLRLPVSGWLHQRTGDSATTPGRATTPTRPAARSALTPLGAVLTIARRELYETLTDWRVLVPVFILTFIIPLGLVAGTNFALSFVAEERQVGRVVPFAILVVGFIPASFSLITALESFVGERERNSLEALLAMPISDKQLYISKLCSSLVVPILTSYAAMLLFASALALFYPDLYAVRMSAERLLQLLVLIGGGAVVMVAGAVIVSSHTGSIRAANLLASFILIPITVIIAIQFPLFIANRWEVVWLLILALIVTAMALMRTGMKTFNREEILSREHEQLNLRRIVDRLHLCFCEYHPAGVPFESYAGASFSPRRFYRRELPALLRELRLPIAAALFAAGSGLLMGIYISSHYDVDNFQRLLNNVGTAPAPSLWLALGIFANNLRVSILSNVFSVLAFGVFAFLVPAVALAQIGFVVSMLQADGGSWTQLGANSPLQFLLGYVLPHGSIELPTFILSAALGIRIGASVLAPPAAFTVGENMLWALANFAKVWLLVLAPLILLGALVEGIISPLIILSLYGL